MSSAPYGHEQGEHGGGEQPPTLAGEIISQHSEGRAYDPYATAPGYAPAPAAALQPYAPQPYPVQQYAPPVYAAPPVMVLPAPKSVGVAFVLTFFFGAFGMFYSTVTGALVMLGIGVAAAILGPLIAVLTMGIGIIVVLPLVLVIWPACIVWGCVAASNHNSRLQTMALQMQQQAYAQQQAAAGYGPWPQR